MYTFSFNKILGFTLAVSGLLVHFSAGLTTNYLSSVIILSLFVVMLTRIHDGMILIMEVLKKNYLPIILFLMFILLPFLGNFLNTGSLYDTSNSLLEMPFRMLFFLLLLMTSNLNNNDLFWSSFLKFFVFVYFYFVVGNLLLPGFEKFTNTSGLFVVLGAIYLHLKSRSNLFKIVLFIFTAYFLYNIMISRTQVIAYIVFHLYFQLSGWLPLILKKRLLIILTISLLYGIYLFINLDHLSYTTGLMNPITSGRGAIWEHYLNYTIDHSPYFGLGHGRSEHIINIGSYYTGQMKVLINVMLSGGTHNSYVYMFVTRGFIGIIIMFLFIYTLLKKPNIMSNDFNVAIFLVAAVTMFATGQSTLGGLTIGSLTMLISLIIPYENYGKNKISQKNYPNKTLRQDLS